MQHINKGYRQEQNLQGSIVALDGFASKQSDPENERAGNSVYCMETFIQQKYGELANLQKYLVHELQEIQSWRGKSKKIEKILVTTTIPTLKFFKESLNTFKGLIEPFCYLSVNFVETVAEKSRELIKEKINQCIEHKQEIQSLRRQVEQLRTKLKTSNECASCLARKCTFQNQTVEQLTENEESKFEYRCSDSNMNGENRSKTKQIIKNPSMNEHRISIISNIETKTISKSNSKSPIKPFQIGEPSPPPQTKTPTKFNKYEEEYHNIMQNKKVNIQYVCKKQTNFGKDQNVSPLKKHRKDEDKNRINKDSSSHSLLGRKQFIKQKIEKIKTKAQYRDYKFQGGK